jgi:hypothetical protein
MVLQPAASHQDSIMKLFLLLFLLAASTAPARAADVGVSVSIGQPGFYGRLDLADYPPPPVLVYQQPRMIERGPVGRPPVYLNVPPGHSRNWRRHCGEYSACNERVYFVNNNWYEREYAPRYQQHYGDRRNDRHGDPRNGQPGNDHERGQNR